MRPCVRAGPMSGCSISIAAADSGFTEPAPERAKRVHARRPDPVGPRVLAWATRGAAYGAGSYDLSVRRAESELRAGLRGSLRARTPGTGRTRWKCGAGGTAEPGGPFFALYAPRCATWAVSRSEAIRRPSTFAGATAALHPTMPRRAADDGGARVPADRRGGSRARLRRIEPDFSSSRGKEQIYAGPAIARLLELRRAE